MRSRVFPLVLSTAFLLAVPLFAHANSIPYFGPIVPSNAATCAASWGSLLQLINNLLAFGITLGITFIAPLLIAYAGFLFVTNPVNPSGKEHAKTVLINTIIGILIALAAYIIVDAFLTAFTYQGVAGWTSQVFVSSGQPCLSINTSENATFNQAPPNQFANGTTGANGLGTTIPTSCTTPADCPGNLTCTAGTCQTNPNLVNGDGTAGAACQPASSNCQNGLVCDNTDTCNAPTANNVPLDTSGEGACNPSVVQQGAAAGGYTLSNSQAQTLSCIAQYESNCGTSNGPGNLNYKWGNGSSAAGAFQVTLQSNYQAYNNNACDAAAGLPAGTSLNCNQGFKGGNSLGNSTSQQCIQAAGNTSCSASAAAYVLQTQGYGAWTADSHSSSQASCINQYSNGSI